MEDRIIELTSALVAIPTHETEEEAQKLIATWLDACGFDCALDDVAPHRPNLVARRGSGGTFLCSHVDVHPPHAHPDPFVCRVEGDHLVGRGVLDAKGQIAALVAAVEARPETPAVIAICCDEEFGGFGSRDIKVPDGPWHADGGIVLEPTAFRICTAQSGHIDLRVEVSGTPGHTYAPEAGGSPITAVLAAIEALDTCDILTARHELLPEPRLHVGRINGGEHLWRRPARASVEIAIGVVPGADLKRGVADVTARLDDLAARWLKRGTSFSYEIADSSDAIEVPAGRISVAHELAAAIGKPFEPAGMPSWTDAANLYLKHDLPCVVFGAGELTAAHSDHEWIRISDLVRLAEVLETLLSARA